MPRWEPGAEDRLRAAALELFLERGYENVTVAEITERAGLTRRSFSRYFADKRDVLFPGAERLPVVLARSVRDAAGALSPLEALLTALLEVAGRIADDAPLAAKRRAVVQASPELQERGRTKFAALTDAAAEALRGRGTAESEARLLAQVGVAVLRTAFDRWVDQPDGADLPIRVREATAELAAGLCAVDLATLPRPSPPQEGRR